jgi:arylsulfatase A-like enzyme
MSLPQRWGGVVAAALIVTVAAAASRSAAQAPTRPNVLLIVTDDQGYGDLGLHGNPRLATPNLDRLGRQSVRFDSFYVSPVCSPTRASLLTGRYNYRTGVVDTYLGRSLMHTDETTLAEMLSGAGYRTGIFGKWHLGDNVPLRASDQGFGEALTLNGGGIGQPSDPPGGESYFDPLLRRNGEWFRAKGYVSDVLASAAIEFIRGNRNRPFFAYLAFNAPHTPLQAPTDTTAKYRAMNLALSDFPHAGHPMSGTFDPETTARVYGMVENIDHNVGRVLAALEDLTLADRTLVIFMTDNGPQQPRYNAGMLRLKGTVNEGGIRVPFFVRLPGRFDGARTVDRIAAHIDVTPTVLEICGVSPPARVRFDGRSLVSLLAGTSAAWPDRTLVFQWHRRDAPERARAFAARSQRYKLVQWQGAGANPPVPAAPPQLFDMEADPFEQRDVAAGQPEIVRTLQRDYDAWFADVTAERDYSDAGVPRIFIGDPRENPVRLTRQDWRGPEAGWTPTSDGHWLVEVRRGGRYAVTTRFAAVAEPATAVFELGAAKLQQKVPAGATSVEFSNVALPIGEGSVSAHVTQGARRVGVLDVVLTRR